VSLRERVSKSVSDLGLPRLTVILFLVSLFIVGGIQGVPLGDLVNSSIGRFSMNALLTISMVPAIQCGIGPNFGLPVGIIAGLIGLVLSMEMGFTGFPGFIVASALGLSLGAVFGVLYGHLLNRVKGQEMMVGTYVGFAVVSGMCMFWLLMPFRHPRLIWTLGGEGLRVTISLSDFFSNVLDNLLAIKIGAIKFPTGLVLCVGLIAALYRLFEYTRAGIAMDLAGQNEQFARAAGINVERMRVTGTAMSTAMGALGIIFYAQSYGFVQLYTAPLMMAFPAVAAVLIGGASPETASISNALVGTLLFQTLLAITVPVSQSVISGDISEIIRLIVSNGMVLYALTRGPGGGNNGS
jgi:simple sugar transport system permease protein